MSERRTKDLPVKKNADRTKIEGYSLRSGAFYAWLKESGYTVSQIAERLDINEKEFVYKLKTKQLFGREHLRILIETMGASAACFAIFFPTFELRQQIYFEVFGKELPLQENRQRRWKKN